MDVFGVDVGGSGIKGAPVDLEAGALATERRRVETPQPSTPEAVVEQVAELVKAWGRDGPVGCAVPAAVKDGRTVTAANIDAGWLGCDARGLLGAALGREVVLLNDADAAGLAEMRYGAGRDQSGVVVILTVGTGIGSAIFIDGRLVPNTELGHIEVRGKAGELRASDRVRKEKELTWPDWARRLDEYLQTLEDLLWPDLIILGGGVSKKHERFVPLLERRTPIVPAQLRNDAGIVGAALAARER